MLRKVMTAMIVALAIPVLGGMALGGEKKAKPAADKEHMGEVRIGTSVVDVSHDDGRFREDNYMTDDWTGGLERLYFDGKSGKMRLEMDLNALYDYDYGGHIKLSRDDLGYMKIDYARDRRYYDGSNEAWNPAEYQLPAVFADLADDQMYTDRTDFNFELGYTPPSGLEIISGWHHWERQGEETWRRGGRAMLSPTNGLNNRRSIPVVSEVNGESDSFYFEAAYPIKEKYNLRFRQEFENYRDNQQLINPRYRNGVLQQNRHFEEEPRFREWRSMIMFDTQFEDNVYVTANFMHDNLESRTTRDLIRPSDANPLHFSGTDVKNVRTSNVYTMGLLHTNFFEVKGLELTAGFRLEDADTNSDSQGWDQNSNKRIATTDMEELRLEENFQFVFRGLKNTVLTAAAEFEQRNLDWTEYEDMQSTETFGVKDFNSGVPFFDYAVDVEHRNERYTLKAVHRFNTKVKVTGQYRYKDLERSYDIIKDNSTLFFPGVMGDWDRKGNDAIFALDWKIYKTWSTRLKYQFTDEDISADVADHDPQEFTNHQYGMSLTGMPFQNCLLVGSFFFDDYSLKTPTSIPNGVNDWEPGEEAYDFDGDSFTFLLNADYAFNSNISANLDYQHTAGIGDVDYGYDKFGIGFTFKFYENHVIRVGYSYYDFDDGTGNGFDDYHAHAGHLSYSFLF